MIKYLPTKQVVFKDRPVQREVWESTFLSFPDSESENTFDVIPPNKLCFLCW